MKLFKVTYSFDVLVIADDADKAKSIAEDNSRDEFENYTPIDCFESCTEITDRSGIPDAWRYSVPRSEKGDGKLTAVQALERIIAERGPVDLPGQGKLF